MYNLQTCILKNRRFKRPKHVIKVLTDNDILDFNDFVEKTVPTKGLWRSEVKILLEMKTKETIIHKTRAAYQQELADKLSEYFSKRETTRVAGVLARNNITTLAQLMRIPRHNLICMNGIGRVTIDILMKIKTQLWEDSKLEFTGLPLPQKFFDAFSGPWFVS